MLVRDAQANDAASIARVQVDSWRTTYAGILPECHLAGLSYERAEQVWRGGLTNPNWQSFIAVAEAPAAGIIGFACGGPERAGRPDYQGELYAIYLLQAYQLQGIGRALVSATAQRLLQRQLTTMLVWVLAANPARRFYEALGGVLVDERTIEIGGASLVEVAYGWKDMQPLAAISKAQ